MTAPHVTAIRRLDGPPTWSVADLARYLDGELLGDSASNIRDLRSPRRLEPYTVCVVLGEEEWLEASSRAGGTVVVPRRYFERSRPTDSSRSLIVVQDGRVALLELIELFRRSPVRRQGVDDGSFVDATCSIGRECWIASGSYLGANTVLGDGVQIHPHAVVGEDCQIGDDSVIYPHVTLYDGTIVGKRVRIHAGAVIGGDGFGYRRNDDDSLHHVPHRGIVVIEDDVEIGANSAIDRATLDETIVRRGCKIDNLVHIGHNSEIGADSLLAAQVGISGSVSVGERSMLMGQVGVTDHVRLAAGSAVGAQGGVVSNLSAGEWLGSPAVPAPLMRRIAAAWRRLPQLLREVRELRAEVERLRSRNEEK